MDLGEKMGGMSQEWLDEKLGDFDYSLQEHTLEETLNGLNAFATTSKINNDDVVDSLIAFLTKKNRTVVTSEDVEDFVKQESSKTKATPKQPTSSNASTSAYNALQRSILKEIPLQSIVQAESEFDGGDDFDYSAFEMSENTMIDRDVKDSSVISTNAVKLCYRSKKFVDRGNDIATTVPRLTLVNSCRADAYTYGNTNVMFELNDLVEESNDFDAKMDEDDKSSSITSVLAGVVMPGDGGRGLNMHNAVLRTSTRSVPLNLEKLEKYALFPGKKLKVTGHLVDGVFQAESIIDHAKLPPTPLDRTTNFDQLKVCVACGPFAADDISSGGIFTELLTHCARTHVNALILVGPFVDVEHRPADAPDDVFGVYLQTLSQFLSARAPRMRVLIVPCAVQDLYAMPYFPTPPYTIPEGVDLHANVTLLPDPAIFELEGVRFAVTASEIVLHLSRREICKSANVENEDRMQRLLSHIFSSKSIYPLCPGDASLPISFTSFQSKTQLTERPHVLIVPSMLQSGIKVMNNCLTLNPGHVIRGKSSVGTFAMVNIDLKSAVNSLEDSIEAFTMVSLFASSSAPS